LVNKNHSQNITSEKIKKKGLCPFKKKKHAHKHRKTKQNRGFFVGFAKNFRA